MMKPLEIACGKILYDSIKINPLSLEEIYNGHKRLLLTRARLTKIIDHLADVGLVRCKADGKAVVVEAVR